jgi:hypothetical protein
MRSSRYGSRKTIAQVEPIDRLRWVLLAKFCRAVNEARAHQLRGPSTQARRLPDRPLCRLNGPATIRRIYACALHTRVWVVCQRLLTRNLAQNRNFCSNAPAGPALQRGIHIDPVCGRSKGAVLGHYLSHRHSNGRPGGRCHAAFANDLHGRRHAPGRRTRGLPSRRRTGHVAAPAAAAPHAAGRHTQRHAPVPPLL